jgi:hypothetical protein
VRLLLTASLSPRIGGAFRNSKDDVSRIAEGLRNGGYETGWPVTYGRWGQSSSPRRLCAPPVFCA